MTFKQHSDRLSLAALQDRGTSFEINQLIKQYFRLVWINISTDLPLPFQTSGKSVHFDSFVHFGRGLLDINNSQGPLSIKTSSLVQCIVKCFQFFFFSDLNLLARHQRGTCKNVNLCVPLVSAQTESYEHLRKNFETGRATPSVKTAACWPYGHAKTEGENVRDAERVERGLITKP